MSYPGAPENQPQSPYTLPAPAGGDYPPPPVPHQQVPQHDQYAPPGPAYGEQYGQQPAYGQYSIDAPNSAPPVAPTMPVPAVGAVPPPMPQSAPPYPMPQSAPPVLLGPPMAEPARKGGATVPLLIGATVLLLIVAGVFVGLYVDKSSKLSDEQKTVASQKTTIADNTSEIDRLTRELKTKTDQLTETEQKLRGSQSLADKTKQERDVVGKCLTLLTQALNAASANNRTVFDAKVREMEEPCAQADKILGTG